MSNTSLFLVIFLVLLLVAVLKFAWSRSMARSQPPRRNDDLDDWDAVQHDRDNHDGGWDSSPRGYSSHGYSSHGDSTHGDSTHGDSSHSDSGGGDSGGGDSSSD